MEEIKNKIDILEVVQKYVKLKKVGKYYAGLCPFHKETKPSFYISPERQIFKCFGCGEGGNVLKFLMKIENLTYPQVLEKLKEDYGLEIKSLKRDSFLEKKFLEINYAALKFFRQKLKENKEALDYLKERGLAKKTIDEFELGFSPGNTLLRDFLYSIGYSLEEIKQVGLLDDRNFDRFQSRIIFPLRNEKGKLIGFNGRLFQKEYGPKYLNSPETSFFKKSEFLYGLFYTKEHILSTKKVYLVEGQFDFLLAWQNGVKNIVALSGSALSEKHLRKLKKYCQEIIFAFDNDEAGFSASLRANLLAKKFGFQTFQAVYSGKDLAEFFSQGFKEIKEEKWEDFLLNYLSTKYGPSKKKEILAHFLPQIKFLKPLEINDYLEKLSDLTGISKNLLEKELEEIEGIFVPLEEKELVEEKTLEEKFSFRLISLIYLTLATGLKKDELDLEEVRKFLPLKFRNLLTRLLENNLDEKERDYFEMTKSFYLNSKLSLKRELEKTLQNLKKVVIKNNLKNLNEKLKLARPEEFDKIVLEINNLLNELRKIEKK